MMINKLVLLLTGGLVGGLIENKENLVDGDSLSLWDHSDYNIMDL